MARKHIRLGYSYSDVCDYGVWGPNARLNPLRSIARELEVAAENRLNSLKPLEFHTRETHLHLAKGALHKAKAWREKHACA